MFYYSKVNANSGASEWISTLIPIKPKEIRSFLAGLNIHVWTENMDSKGKVKKNITCYWSIPDVLQYSTVGLS